MRGPSPEGLSLLDSRDELTTGSQSQSADAEQLQPRVVCNCVQSARNSLILPCIVDVHSLHLTMSGASALKQLSRWKVVGGYVTKYQHHSTSTRTDMKFSVFTPPSITGNSSTPVPAIYFLSGLTCTDDNFIQKAGAFKAAAKANVALICPDTSPRGLNLPEEKNTAISGQTWDFGESAGFYLNATQAPFKGHYNMFDYVTRELPEVIAQAQIGVDAVKRRSVMGHSMGGHGALVSFLKNPGMYASCSAFAPICHPSSCDWGRKAFTGYLGEDKEAWKQWDSTFLAEQYAGPPAELFIDQGGADDNLPKGQLLPEKLQEAVKKNDGKLSINYQLRDGYDHSYFFIQSFVDEHIEFHAKHLNAQK